MDSTELGKEISQTRKRLKLTQADLALVANTAPRFISDLENGKPSCHLGKTLSVLQALGIKLTLVHPELGDEGHD